MYKNILVPVDLSHVEDGGTIVARAKQLLDREGGQITLMNVLPVMPKYVAIEMPAGLLEKTFVTAEQELRALVQKHDLSETTNVKVVHGNVVHEILEVAKQNAADLVVIAAHQPGLADVFLGSVAGRIVRQAPCSVLVVR